MHELLNRSKFNDYLSSVSGADDKAMKIQQLLQTLENELAGNIRTPATVHVVTDNTVKNAVYDHRTNTIIIPYKANTHGLYYYSSLKHEDAHADQTHGQRDSVEKMLLNVSRAIYPQLVDDGRGNPTNVYLYNYGELDAKCAEIKAINDAFTARIKAVPPDCNIIEKDEILKVMQDIWPILSRQQSNFVLRLVQLQNIASVLTGDSDPSIMPCKSAEAIRFLATTAPALYKAKLEELQEATKTFHANMQALRTWTLPQNRQMTQEAERSAMEWYVEQEHQKVLQCVKSSGAHYDEFPPQDAHVEVTQLASDRLLQWYLDAHHEEAEALYIVHVDVNAKEHSYIAHRILPDDNTHEMQLDAESAPIPDVYTDEPDMEAQYDNEMDVDCL